MGSVRSIRVRIMTDLSYEEKFILEKLKENGGNLGYKQLQELCANEFEGVRLVLKKMKEKGLVEFDGMIPGFSADITLTIQ
ncbi:MAG: hypothetical protein BAJALOKI3v1_60064 [Promethearchaeota archaeon]|nr:MAG: hypothetical protein BAJALOKI3v1_60064 [Candidatus Lokiarchaeota archaeon]